MSSTTDTSSSMAKTATVVVGAATAAVGAYILYRRYKEMSERAVKPLTWEMVQAQDASTSNAIIALLRSDSRFAELAKAVGDEIVARDSEDAEKLQAGIDIGIERGVIDGSQVPEPYQTIAVDGRSPDEVCGAILAHLGDAPQKGCVIVLCGLSGTGKGTTVAKLKQKLPKAVTWSNGNIFRSLTLLAATWCQQNVAGGKFDAAKALTKENLASFMKMLEFRDFGEGRGFDTRIKGLGLDHYVSDVSNTVLKGPLVKSNIPTVAKETQGEVINFAADATAAMGKAGMNVLLEGREQTVNFVRTPYRYTLTLSNTDIIGQRRAAQILGAAVYEDFASAKTPPSVADLDEALRLSLQKEAASA